MWLRMVTEVRVVRRATLPVSLPMSVVEKVEELRARLGYRSRNEVVREALRRFIEDIEETKVVSAREMTLEQAKERIVEYLRRHDSAYVSEMAEDLGIEIELAFEAVKELEKGGVVGE